MRILLITLMSYVSFIALVHSSDFSEQSVLQKMQKYHQDIVLPERGIGARETGTAQEAKALLYVEQAFKQMNLSVSRQTFALPKSSNQSGNVIADTNPALKKTLVIGAHVDSIGAAQGSQGATDNGTGLAVLLTVASQLSNGIALPINIRFIAFGAEEIGKLGSIHYVTELQKHPNALSNIIAMINLDTIAGGDLLYVHSAHTTPYHCDGIAGTYNSKSELRTALATLSQQLSSGLYYTIHPAYKDYPEGVTGDWSDHAPFACAGIPTAYIESTNFDLNGQGGFDGYSQSSEQSLWSCFDAEQKGACDRQSEQQWGHIWHSRFDQLALLNELFPQRLDKQMLLHVKVLTSFIKNINKNFPLE